MVGESVQQTMSTTVNKPVWMIPNALESTGLLTSRKVKNVGRVDRGLGLEMTAPQQASLTTISTETVLQVVYILRIGTNSIQIYYTSFVLWD